MVKKYNVLLLDADDTLLDFKATERESVKKVLSEFGVPADDATVSLYSSINKALWKAHERGEISRQEILDRRFTQLFEALSVEADGIEAERRYRFLLGEGKQVIPGALELCERLRKNYRLYIITNGVAKTQRSRLEGSGITSRVDGIFISEEIGISKPNAGFFDAVFAELKVPREEALIVGDSLTSDIKGGINAGVDTCWYNPEALVCDGDVLPTYEIDALNKLEELLKAIGE